MQGEAILGRVNGDSADAHFGGSAHDTDRNLAAVGDEDAADRARVFHDRLPDFDRFHSHAGIRLKYQRIETVIGGALTQVNARIGTDFDHPQRVRNGLALAHGPPTCA